MTETDLPDVPDTSPDEVAARVEAARHAAPGLAGQDLRTRAAMLAAMADDLAAAEDDLVPVAHAETALPHGRLVGELARTTGQLRLFAEVVETGDFLEAIIDPPRPDATPPRPDVRRMLSPLGPVAVFGASNFPFAFSVAGGDTASALAAGCPVVIKANPGHPNLSEAVGTVLAEAADRVGAPAGTVAVVHGLQAGRDLVTHPAIRAVGFTGSPTGGRALFDLATDRADPIPFYGELGSINPVVVTAGALQDRPEQVADGLVGSFTLGTGQFCTKPGVVLVPAGSDLDERVADRLDGQPEVMLNDNIASNFHHHLDLLDENPRLRRVASAGPGSGRMATAAVYATTVADLLDDPDNVLAEHFGPVTILVDYADDAELRAALEAVPGTLTLSVHATEDEHADLDELVELMADRAGRVIFDGWPTGVAVTHAMHHGGPWPSTTAPLHTSVGTTAIRRWLRPVAWQDCPDPLLPPALRDANPQGLLRRVDGQLTRESLDR